MEYKIWQVKQGMTRDFGFMTLKERKEVLKTEEINLAVYAMVYAGELSETDTTQALNDMFRIFNVRQPRDFKGRSLSVSDIVEIKGKFYYCDSADWKEVNPTKGVAK